MLKQTIFILLVILAYLIETSATPLAIFKYINFSLIVILIYNFYFSFNFTSFILPLLIGFLKDIANPIPFGLYIFLFILIIVIVNFLKNKFFARFNIIAPILITIIITVIYYLAPIIFSFTPLLSYRYNLDYYFLRQIIFSVFLNTISVVLIYWFYARIKHYLNRRFIKV